jgi:hypothetical protein
MKVKTPFENAACEESISAMASPYFIKVTVRIGHADHLGPSIGPITDMLLAGPIAPHGSATLYLLIWIDPKEPPRGFAR